MRTLNTNSLSRTNGSAQAGFTVIELLLTAFIMGVGLLGLAALQTAGIRTFANGRQRDTAAYLAKFALEDLTVDGRQCANMRGNGLTPPNVLNFYTTPALDTPINYVYNGNPEFSIDGTPVAAGTGLFKLTYVVLSNAKGGNSLPVTQQFGNEVVVNVNWKEETTNANGVRSVNNKWLSINRYIRY